MFVLTSKNPLQNIFQNKLKIFVCKARSAGSCGEKILLETVCRRCGGGGGILGIAGQIINISDCQFCEEFLGACGVALQNAQSYQAAVQEYKKNQLLLNLAKSLFQEQTSLDRLITSIIVQAKEMLQCERCTIFLLDLKMYDQVRAKQPIFSLSALW